MLKIEVISSKTIASPDAEKKHVLYRICIIHDVVEADTNPSYLERRYTHFFDLFNDLKKYSPSLMSTVNFPKKVMIGNFDPELISNRSTGFGSFLEYVAKETRLREAPCTVGFFQNLELQEAKKLMSENKFDQALSLLENIFTLLNKIYTDRSRVVLIALCRLVACGSGSIVDPLPETAALAGPSERWANLALRRFDAVSDTDLLSLYVPLIKACICIWKTLGKDCKPLELNLEDMKKRGIRVVNCSNLMSTIDKLETLTDIY